MSLNDQLRDAMVRLAIQLSEVENRIHEDLLDQLSSLQYGLERFIELRQDVTQLPTLVAQQTLSGLQEVSSDVMSSLASVASRIAEATNALFSERLDTEQVDPDTLFNLAELIDVFGPGVAFWADFLGLTEEETRALFASMFLFGLTPTELWHRWSEAQARAVQSRMATILSEEMAGSFATGNTSVDALVLGRMKLELSSVLISSPSSAAAKAKSLVTSILSKVLNDTTRLLVDRNQHIFRSTVWWSAILDTHTCIRCGNLNGQTFPIESLPPCPLHHLCRCLLVPMVEGPDPTTINFGDWLRGQPREYLDAILGKRGAELFLSGKVRIRNFVSFQGRVTPRRRTIEEVSRSL